MVITSNFALADFVVGYDNVGNTHILKNRFGNVIELTPELVRVDYFVSVDRPEIKKVLIGETLKEID